MSRRPHEFGSVVAGAAICAVIGLAVTAHAVFSPRVLAHYADSPDSVNIAESAEASTPRDILRWWTGSWLQKGSVYYRPLSSILFWLEYRAFGWDFQGYVIISWLVHGWICASLFLLGLSIFGASTQGALTALVAVALFNVRLGPTGPSWSAVPVSYGVVAWWPAQTDQMSLAFSLGALIVLDGWLKGTRRNGLWLAAILWIAALLFKEMAVTLPLVAGCLILHRRGWASLRLRQVEDTAEGRRARLAPGLFWKVVLPALAGAAAFLALRSFLVAQAWGPKGASIVHYLQRALWQATERPVVLFEARGPWLLVISGFLALCIYLYARLPRRPSAVWLVMTMVIGAGALGQLLAGNFAIITIPRELGAIGTMTLFILGSIVLLHVRTGPAWPLLASALAVHLPILHVQGPHYFYWPAAFWGLFNASLLLYIWQRAAADTLQWQRRDAEVGAGNTVEQPRESEPSG